LLCLFDNCFGSFQQFFWYYFFPEYVQQLRVIDFFSLFSNSLSSISLLVNLNLKKKSNVRLVWLKNKHLLVERGLENKQAKKIIIIFRDISNVCASCLLCRQQLLYHICNHTVPCRYLLLYSFLIFSVYTLHVCVLWTLQSVITDKNLPFLFNNLFIFLSIIFQPACLLAKVYLLPLSIKFCFIRSFH